LVTADEYARSEQAFQRPFCDRCMYKKQTMYQQEGKRLVSVCPKNLAVLDGLLAAKLRVFGFAL
jgi:hypothetical protein